jgi:hypothetical protein
MRSPRKMSVAVATEVLGRSERQVKRLKQSFDRGDRASFFMREIAVSRSTVRWILRRRRARKEAEFPTIARWIGRRDGDTLVVDVTSFFGKAWFDPAGNFHSDGLNVVERYSPARSSRRGPYAPPEDELSTVSPSK